MHYDFTVKGCKILEAGWRYIKNFSEDDAEPIQDLARIEKGDELKIKNYLPFWKKKTKPPVLYMQSWKLLSAMETAGKEIETKKKNGKHYKTSVSALRLQELQLSKHCLPVTISNEKNL